MLIFSLVQDFMLKSCSYIEYFPFRNLILKFEWLFTLRYIVNSVSLLFHVKANLKSFYMQSKVLKDKSWLRTKLSNEK